MARPSCGTGGKVANGQVAVPWVYADPAVHWPGNGRLDLPQEWAEAPARRPKAGVPEEGTFQPKPELALKLLEEARARSIPHQAILAEADSGKAPAFLEGVEP